MSSPEGRQGPPTWRPSLGTWVVLVAVLGWAVALFLALE